MNCRIIKVIDKQTPIITQERSSMARNVDGDNVNNILPACKKGPGIKGSNDSEERAVFQMRTGTASNISYIFWLAKERGVLRELLTLLSPLEMQDT